MSSGDNKIATFEDVKNIDAKTLLIDVREAQELKDTGILPNSINIPLGQIEDAFKLTNEEFKQRFSSSKPTTNEPIIFSCKAGIRSDKAMKIVAKLGFSNGRNYLGGWLDWEEQIKK